MYSYYQNQKSGIISRYYTEVDILIFKNKINKIESNYNGYDIHKKVIADKLLKLYHTNINFINSMINQQILEEA